MKNIVINKSLYRINNDLYDKLRNQKTGNESDRIVCDLLHVIENTHKPVIRVDNVFTP